MDNRFLRLIEVLTRHQVRFIVVGGVAAVLQRTPINIQDFDLVHERTPENVGPLLSALAELKAVYRDDPRNLTPSESHLLGSGNQLLRSGNLRFDILGSIDGAADTTTCSRIPKFSMSAGTRYVCSRSRN